MHKYVLYQLFFKLKIKISPMTHSETSEHNSKLATHVRTFFTIPNLTQAHIEFFFFFFFGLNNSDLIEKKKKAKPSHTKSIQKRLNLISCYNLANLIINSNYAVVVL
jgi:hypothetical protein